MGDRKKRKETAMMRRSIILSITVIFAASFIAAAPVSFAVKYDGRDIDTDRYNEYNEYNDDDGNTYDDNGDEAEKHDYSSKDTSWFDYKDRKDTYEISTEGELIGLASLVNEQQVDRWKPTRIENFEDVTFVLTDDIELTSKWAPIGTGGASYFAGIFDGNGHTISGLDVSLNSGTAGFFGYLVGTVKDLTVKGKVESEDSNTGGIAGTLASSAHIAGCTSHVKVSGRDKVGGIAGTNNGGTVELSLNYGKINGAYKVGGIVGENWGGIISECGNRGDISSSRRGVGTYGTGGVAGRSVSSDSSVTRSFNQGKISSNTEATGGVVGYVNAEGANVSECYNTGDISVKKSKKSRSMSESYAGGIIGILGSSGISVSNCYNSAAVLNADISGGVIGYYINESSSGNDTDMRNNYYPGGDFTSGIGQMEVQGDRNAEKSVNSVSGRGFSGLVSGLPGVYKEDEGIYGNNGYPVLMWQEAVSADEKIYTDIVSEDTQKKLNRYLLKSTEGSSYGHDAVSFFSPENYVNDAVISYNENMRQKNSEYDEQ